MEIAQSPINKDHVENKYKEKVRSPLTGVRAFCVKCQGGTISFVRDCAAVSCPLWPFRMGNNPFFGKLSNADAESIEEYEEEEDIA